MSDDGVVAEKRSRGRPTKGSKPVEVCWIKYSMEYILRYNAMFYYRLMTKK